VRIGFDPSADSIRIRSDSIRIQYSNRFEPYKTVCVHFCRLHKLHRDPLLALNGSATPVVEETKFLGIIFDRKLSFLPHIRHLKDKCTKALNLLRVIVHTAWGADQQTLIHLYRSLTYLLTYLIRSKLDYGCVVYLMARLEAPTYACWIRCKIMLLLTFVPRCLLNVAIFQFICLSQ